MVDIIRGLTMVSGEGSPACRGAGNGADALFSGVLVALQGKAHRELSGLMVLVSGN